MYLSAEEVKTRLQARYSVPAADVAALGEGDALVASEAFDALAPFEPEVAMSLDEDPTGGTLPDALKDWIALKALTIVQDDSAPVISEGAGRSSTTFAAPDLTRTQKRMRELITPYLRRKGSRS